MFAISHIVICAVFLYGVTAHDFESRLASLEQLVVEQARKLNLQDNKLKSLEEENTILHQQIANITSPLKHMTRKYRRQNKITL